MIAESLPPASQSSSSTTPMLAVVPKSKPVQQPEVLPKESLEERYYRLRDRSQQLVDQGRLDDALEALKESLTVAREIGDDLLIATATCNVAGIAIWVGNTEEHIGDLRAILMRNFDADTSYRAAYQLSHAYELLKQFKKAVFYARIARDRAQAAREPSYVAKSLNQLGNGMVGESQFQDAVASYQEALAQMEPGMNSLSVPSRINCAYCLIVLGQVHEGMAQLFGCLRWMRRQDLLPVYQAWAHLFLCCGHLELGKLRHAWRHGMKARTLAEQTGDYGAIKSSLFMLGEVERCAGDQAGSFEWFSEMQQRFFPESPEMPGLMSVVGMTRVVNLRA